MKTKLLRVYIHKKTERDPVLLRPLWKHCVKVLLLLGFEQSWEKNRILEQVWAKRAALTELCDVLRNATERFRADKEIILFADNALQYASPDLKADKEIVSKAVSQTAFALGYAHESLRADRLLI